MIATAHRDPALAPNLREKPYKESPIIGELQPGEEVSIVEGPSCSRGRVWWKVISKKTGATGWALEGDGKNYWLNPIAGSKNSITTQVLSGEGNTCRADYQSRLKTGDTAYVSYNPPLANNVREKPNKSAKSLGKIQPGEKIYIIEGPSCSNGWVWWKIRSKKTGLSGWTAEGDRENYWLIPD